MIVARRLLTAGLKPITAAFRMARTFSEATPEKMPRPDSRAHRPAEEESAPSLLDLTTTLKCVNYRYEFPQGLTEEQKKKMKRFDVFRHDPLNSDEPAHFVSYYIDLAQCGPMFLDALIKIKSEIDPTLSFRRSCREGICGSCSMNLDGRHTLACITAIPRNNLEKSFVAPLTFMNVLKDLVVDMTHFYNQYKTINPFLQRKTPKQPGQKEYYQSVEERAKIDGLYECVLCLSCSSSCPSYWWHSNEYLGPSILQQAFRWVIDSRDEYREERLEALGGDMKMDECFQLGICSLACPKGLDPRKAIEELKELYHGYKTHKTQKQNTVSI